jgi:hypothetical protein
LAVAYEVIKRPFYCIETGVGAFGFSFDTLVGAFGLCFKRRFEVVAKGHLVRRIIHSKCPEVSLDF